ncbi:MAG TPA: MBL fold metallo-hydrolase [Caulobacteraceae bacterium]
MKLTFHGAAGCVTGFCARLDTGRARVLIDCGMFQGSKTLKALNYEPFPFEPREIDAVLLTHAHIDHSGLLPKLMKAGFAGPVFATAGTRDLCAVMLADAGGIQESEVRHLNRRNQQRGRPQVEPIYTEADARRTMRLFEKVKLGEPAEVAPGVTATWWEAGHLLGSGSIEVAVETEEGPVRLLFSGDIGGGGSDYLPDPDAPSGVDHLIMESTYGNRERPPMDGEARRAMLARELNEAHDAGGPLLIPAFAIERSQELLVDILRLMDDGQVPAAEIFLDSPLAIEATEVFQRRGWNRAVERNPFERLTASGRLKFTRTPRESDRLEMLSGWHIIVAGSGMCEAGRVRRHLKRLLWRREASVLLSGFQAVGTLGRILQDGARRVTIQGDDIQVRARVRALDVYSGHADAGALVAWAKARGPVAGDVFLAHGEPGALAALRGRLGEAGFERIAVPDLDQTFTLTRATVTAQAATPRIPPASAAAMDWHNDRAAFLVALNQRLDTATDEERRVLLERLAAALG